MSGVLKLSLENFQSISSGELVFEKGLNFIIGQSNSGKSATFRALKACLSNPAGSQRFIKKGTKKASVQINYEGNEIIWNRTSKESSYTVNGEDYVKTGKSNAFKILENTHIGFVRDDNDTIMNIEEELQLPFPFGLSEFELFKLYENVFCVSDSAVILKAAKEQEDFVKSEITSLDLDLSKNKVKLSKVEEFEKYVDLGKLKSFKTSLMSKRERLVVLGEGREVINQAIKLDNTDTSFNEVTFENRLDELKEKKEIKSTLIKTKKAHVASKSMQELSLDIENLIPKYTDLMDTKQEVAKLGNLKGFNVEERDFKNRIDKYNELLFTQETMEVLKSLNGVEMPSFSLKEKLSRYNELKETKALIDGVKHKLAEAKKDYENLNKVIKEKEEKLKEFKVCPLCHRALEN